MWVRKEVCMVFPFWWGKWMGHTWYDCMGMVLSTNKKKVPPLIEVPRNHKVTVDVLGKDKEAGHQTIFNNIHLPLQQETSYRDISHSLNWWLPVLANFDRVNRHLLCIVILTYICQNLPTFPLDWLIWQTQMPVLKCGMTLWPWHQLMKWFNMSNKCEEVVSF
jgi:hypothetical protein